MDIPRDDCWLYAGPLSPWGYGRVKLDRSYAVHRLMYEDIVGPVPKDLVLDHLCRIRHCVNPAHLEIVDSRTNVLRGVGISAVNARKTHCKNGHEFSESNTYRRLRGHRECYTCRRNDQQAIRDRRKMLIAGKVQRGLS